MYTNLLAKQIHKFIKGETPDSREWKQFLDAVNQSYEHYERDHRLGKRSLEITSKEMLRIVEKLNARAYITHLFLENTTFRELIPKILETLCMKFGWDIACYWMPNIELKIARMAYSFSPSNAPAIKEFMEHRGNLILSLSNGIENKIWSSKVPYYTNDIQQDHLMISRDEAVKAGLTTYLGLPVHHEDNFFGILQLFSTKNAIEDQELLAIFSELGTTLGLFIERQNGRLRELQLQVEFAREAGMRQMATSVIHNIGNVLNTINISITEINEYVSDPKLENLPKVAELITKSKNNISSFIADDPIGRKVPDYIIALAEWWKGEQSKCIATLDNLRRNIEHVKNIMNTQQSTSTAKNSNESISLNSVFDELLLMKKNAQSCFDIDFIKKCEIQSDIITDKNKLLQIIINLLDNAIHAVKDNVDKPKTITLKSSIHESKIQIEIIDNGYGINPDHLTKLFDFGFTTKKDGHGYGLHSCYNLAKELGGELSAKSNGPNEGATFILILPRSSEVA